MTSLEGQVAIVTGSATGIGYGIAKRLSEEGANIVMVDFDPEMAEQSSSEMAARGTGVEVSIGDVAEPQTAQDAVKKALDKCCLLYTSPSPRDRQKSRMPWSA